MKFHTTIRPVLQLSSLEYVESLQKAGKKPKPATKAVTKVVRL
jgi:hypothetical protein